MGSVDPFGLISRKAARGLPSKNERNPSPHSKEDDGATTNPHRGHAVNNLSNRPLELLAFSIATLLATVVLVIAGLNERTDVPKEAASLAHTTKGPR